MAQYLYSYDALKEINFEKQGKIYSKKWNFDIITLPSLYIRTI